ncbi:MULTISPECIES: DUF4339 domain-containing protein [unclassified Pseudomonas]|nr:MULTISPECIES: DUF4339 domain-containing protein [unclassified Pseudomonas]MEB0148714.1 DUF4339 domain-containing protein [Pseudomonas sp. CCC2.2]MEE3506612.1 DUF4339 domain-containing protein [Pseudomonas sp. 10C3]WPX68808.1 DUF4339 domain-containing protein [Pseudomonas sp. MH9.2]
MELGHHLAVLSPPPLTGAGVSNTLAWLLAFAPIIGYLLEAFVASLMGNSGAQLNHALADNRYWYVSLILNISLSLFDEMRLKQTGHDTSRFKSWAFIVPVYLYQRAKMLNQKLGVLYRVDSRLGTYVVCLTPAN